MSSEKGGSPSDRQIFDPYDMGIIAITIITLGELVFLILVLVAAYFVWRRQLSPWLHRRKQRRLQARQTKDDAVERRWASTNGAHCAGDGANGACGGSPRARQSREDARRRRAHTRGSEALGLASGAVRHLSALNPVPARIDTLPSLELQDIEYHAGVETITTPDGEKIEYCIV